MLHNILSILVGLIFLIPILVGGIWCIGLSIMACKHIDRVKKIEEEQRKLFGDDLP